MLDAFHNLPQEELSVFSWICLVNKLKNPCMHEICSSVEGYQKHLHSAIDKNPLTIEAMIKNVGHHIKW